MNIEIIRSLVRPFIAVSFVLMTAYCVYKGQITGKDVLTVMGIIMAFYFSERALLKKAEGGNNEPTE